MKSLIAVKYGLYHVKCRWAWVELFHVESVDIHGPLSFGIHLIIFGDVCYFKEDASCQLAGCGRWGVGRIAGDDQIFHPMLFGKFKKQLAGFGGIVVAAIWFVNTVANIAPNVGLFVVTDS